MGEETENSLPGMAGVGKPSPPPFDWILGEWRLDRVIPGHAIITGKAEVVLLADGDALYRERVAVALASGKTLTGGCSYRHQRTEAGLDIYFAGTRQLFQSLRFRPREDELIAESRHQCGLDLYSSEYVLRVGEGFTVRHTVCGPRKSYVSTTEFRRSGLDGLLGRGHFRSSYTC